MNTLAWKEWRENRVIVGFAALLVLLSAAIPLIGVMTHLESQMQQSDLLVITLSICGISALFCGSAIVAPEVGNGSLQLLSTLPVSRGKIWWTKIAMGLLVMAASIVVSSLVMLLIGVFGTSIHLVSIQQSLSPPQFVTEQVEVALVSTIFLFAVGSVVTMLADRTISALMGSAVVAAILYLGITWTLGEILLLLPHRQDTDFSAHIDQLKVLIFTFALMTLNLFAASYKLFVDGETLKTRKRFMILIPYAMPAVVIIALVVVASWLVKVQ